MSEEISKQRIKAKAQIAATDIEAGDVLLMEHAPGTTEDADKSMRMDTAKEYFTGAITALIPDDATTDNKLATKSDITGFIDDESEDTSHAWSGEKTKTEISSEIAAQIESSVATDVGWDLTINTNLLKKVLNIVSIQIDVARRETGYSIPDSNYALVKIPENFRPSINCHCAGRLIKSDWSAYKICSVDILSSGAIRVGYSESTDGYGRIQIFGSYPL